MRRLRNRLVMFFEEGDLDWLLVILFVPAMIIYVVWMGIEDIVDAQ